MNASELHDEISVRLLAAAAPDHVLLAAAKRGGRPAFTELWERHTSRAFKRVYRITGKRADTEVLIRNAWVKAYLHLKNFDGRSKFSTWFTRVATKMARMVLRRKRSHHETCLGIMDGKTSRQWEDGDQTTDAEGYYLPREDLERLRGAVCHFRSSVRTVIEVLQLHEVPMAEIAYLAGASISATKSRLLRTRTVLRSALDRKAIEIWIVKLAFVIYHMS
jgi:RNA polymerase sigma-70 factor (ECF subfamily)